MAKKNAPPTYDEAVVWLRDHGFDIVEAPGTRNRVFLKKLNVSAAIEKADDGTTRLFAKPGYLLSGEISRLVDKGYQKFLKSSKSEVPATADATPAWLRGIPLTAVLVIGGFTAPNPSPIRR